MESNFTLGVRVIGDNVPVYTDTDGRLVWHAAKRGDLYILVEELPDWYLIELPHDDEGYIKIDPSAMVLV